jgi:hypothetical protein
MHAVSAAYAAAPPFPAERQLCPAIECMSVVANGDCRDLSDGRAALPRRHSRQSGSFALPLNSYRARFLVSAVILFSSPARQNAHHPLNPKQNRHQ